MAKCDKCGRESEPGPLRVMYDKIWDGLLCVWCWFHTTIEERKG